MSNSRLVSPIKLGKKRTRDEDYLADYAPAEKQYHQDSLDE